MKKMALGAKMFAGFAVVLLLLVITAGVGFNGLFNVSGRVQNREDINSLVHNITEARRFEKNFVIRGDAESAAKVAANVNELKSQAQAAKDKLSDEANRQQMDQVVAATDAYHAAFARLVELAAKREKTMDTLREQSEVIQVQCEALAKDQQDQLAQGLAKSRVSIDKALESENNGAEVMTLRADQDAFADDKQAKIRDANSLVQWFLLARLANKEFIVSHGEAKWAKELDKYLADSAKLAADLNTRFKDETNKKQMAQIIGALDVYRKGTTEYAGLMDQQNEADKAMVEAARKATEACSAAMLDQKEKLASASASAQVLMAGGAGGGLIIGLVLAFIITRSITRPIDEVIKGLSNGSAQVASAAGQVSGASQSLAEGASQQAASLEETSSSLEEMGSMTKQNADSAQQADSLTRESETVINEATQAMTELRQAMERISGASNQTSKIIKTIDEIAFQTNLLALNAAVEAARAGEAGAGFAVVAEEVRNLALRAAEAAKNTTALIEESLRNINDGSALVNRTDEAFGRVSQSAMKVGELVAEIAAASKEQAVGIAQINMAATEMDRVTQLNAANAEESAAASEELSAQAEQMLGHVSDLAALVRGGGAGRSTERTLTAKAAPRAPLATKASAAKPAQAPLRLPIIPANHKIDDENFSEF